MEQKRNSDLDKFSIIRLIERVDKDRVAQVYQLNYKEFMLLNSDDVEIDGRQVDFIERNLYLMAGKKFSFEACKTKQGFELTENDFLKNQFTIIENGRQYLTQFRHLKQLEIYYDYLISKKASLEKPKPEKKLISFVWQNNAENELPELFSLMLDKYKLIAPETTLEQFKAIFTGQPIESIEPVKWHQDNASELLYFYIQLLASKNIDGNLKKLDYQKLSVCFVKPDGQPYEASFKQLKTNIEINLSDEKKNNISSLIKEF
jgi:hypothetical protein